MDYFLVKKKKLKLKIKNKINYNRLCERNRICIFGILLK